MGWTAILVLSLILLVLGLGGSWPVACVMAGIFFLPASELAVALTNLLAAAQIPPRLLPKLEFRDGIPPTQATLVVVPAMLTSRQEIDDLVQRLERHYLSNLEPALRFALLTDVVDAHECRVPADGALVAHAVEKIRALNRQYEGGEAGPFYLLHRGRRWNANAGRWMGWERKRGKLMELGRLLRGAADTSYEVIEGNRQELLPAGSEAAFRYVITLDADTELPPGTARRLVGAITHPLNHAHLDDSGGVADGYILLQPRIGVHLGSATRTWFARIFRHSPGIDPYACAASDVYQDLFGDGSFTGKGIYELEAFERALEGVFPENHILSHDLIEGCHARVGLVSDIELIDRFPARYDAESRRQHRWVRGDWQLLPWLLPRVPSAAGWRPNRLTLLAKWKISDNLRRSLVPPALLAMLVLGWLIYPSLAGLWSAAALLVLGFPLLAQIEATLRNWPRGMSWREYRRAWTVDVLRTFWQALLMVVFLPHRAWLMADAIARTLFRLVITRRRLLEWETAAATEQRLRGSRWSMLATMWMSPVLALLLAALLPLGAWPAAGGFLAAWLVAPLVAHWISLPISSRQAELTAAQRQWLRGMARRIWSFFERFVNADDHWLPPDNFQEYPAEKVAHRVSPTNEGLFLLSALVARGFRFCIAAGPDGALGAQSGNLERIPPLARALL